MKRLLVTAAALMLMVSLVGLAEAARGEVCYSSPVAMTAPNSLENTTTFVCPSLGSVTIPQIYRNGWRIVHLSQQSMIDHATMTNTDVPPGGHSMWMIVIEQP